MPQASDGGNPSSNREQEVKTKSGRVIDIANPVLTMLLEPRSLVITTGELYTSHLHGIEPLAIDDFSYISSTSPKPTDSNPENGRRIANLLMMADGRLREVVQEGRTIERQTRVSLTCRDVERVFGMSHFAPGTRMGVR